MAGEQAQGLPVGGVKPLAGPPMAKNPAHKRKSGPLREMTTGKKNGHTKEILKISHCYY
jgi:hypothetical protein